MLDSVGLCDAVGSDGRGEGDALRRYAAAASGDVDGDVGGAAASSAIPGVCEAGQVREEGAAAGVAGTCSEGCAMSFMQFAHLASTNVPKDLRSAHVSAAPRGMDDGYSLLFCIAERYVKNGGPPAQPPAWLQPPAQQSGGRAGSVPRRSPSRIDEGRAVPAARQGLLEGPGTGFSGALA